MAIAARPEDKATLEKVTDIRRLTDNLFTFRTTRPTGFKFTAGQYARLGLDPGDANPIWRAYSITSAPDDDQLEFYGVLVPGGLFTGMLKDIAPGSPMWVEKQPYGFMTADRFTEGEDLWMLATGTGLGPYVSILRDPDVWTRFRRLIVVHCARHANELSYRDEMLAAAAAPPGSPDSPATFTLIQSVTRDLPHDAEAAGLLHGRITTLLQDGALERAAGVPLAPEGSRVMLCGNPQMIEETRKLLHERGMRPVRRALPGQFVTENYW